MKISFIIPCYCSKNNIKRVVDEIKDVMTILKAYEYEIILVNDCSPDNTIDVLKELYENEKNIIVVDLVKNQGQPSALLCGFSYATGDICVCGDDDGQTPYLCVPQMIDKLNMGNYDIVCAKYVSRGKRSVFRSLGTSANEKMLEIIFDKDKEISLSAFFAARKYIIDEITKYKGPYPYLAGLILRTTRNIGNIDAEQEARLSGKSGYNWKKLIRLWVNGFTTFSIKPLRLASIFGLTSAFIGFASGVICIIMKILVPTMAQGWSSVMALIAFMGGIIMLLLGIIGEYLGRIYICINNSPQYVVKKIYGKTDR